MKGHYWIAAVGFAAAIASGSALARTDVSVNIGIPGPAIVAPAPVYAPPPLYAAPAPLVVAPPPPVIYAQRPHYWRGPPPGHWRHDRGWDRRWDRHGGHYRH